MHEPLVPLVDNLPEATLSFELPTPFPVGPVNCYVLLDAPVTVVDPGMIFRDTLATLGAELEGVGLRVCDVEAVVVTHAHPDHYGAAGWLAEQADAPIYAGRARASTGASRRRWIRWITASSLQTEDERQHPSSR